MKIANKRKMSRSIINNNQNLERYIILKTVPLHFGDTAIQDSMSKKSWAIHDFFLLLKDTGSVYLLVCLKTVGFSLCHITACNIAPKQDSYPVFKSPDTSIDLASLWMTVLNREKKYSIHFRNMEVSFLLNICSGK